MRFVIFKGKHKSKPTMFRPYFLTKEFEWNVEFSKECWYDRTKVGSTGANKLKGITFGTHHENPWGKCKSQYHGREYYNMAKK